MAGIKKISTFALANEKWRFRLAARTHASHAWNTGSIPVGATKKGVLRNSFLCFMQLFLTLIIKGMKKMYYILIILGIALVTIGIMGLSKEKGNKSSEAEKLASKAVPQKTEAHPAVWFPRKIAKL